MHNEFLQGKKVRNVKGNPEAEKIADDLRQAQTKMSNLVRELVEANQQITDRLLKERWEGPESDMNLIKFCEWLRDEEKDLRAKNTIKCYNNHITALKGFDTEITLKGITPEWIQSFQKHLRKKGNSNNSVLAKMWYLSKVMTFAAEGGYIANNPMKKFKIGQYEKPDATFLEPEEIERVRSAYLNEELLHYDFPMKKRNCRSHKGKVFHEVLRAVLVSINTGLRFSNVNQLTRPAKLTPAEGYEFSKTHLTVRMKKTGVLKRLKITEKMREVLDFSGKGPALPIKFYQNCYVNNILRGIAAILKINTKLNFHAMRHTFTSELSRRGVRIEHLQPHLGHRDLRTTMIYAHIHKTELDTAMPAMDDAKSPEQELLEMAAKMKDLMKENPDMLLSNELRGKLADLTELSKPQAKFKIAK